MPPHQRRVLTGSCNEQLDENYGDEGTEVQPQLHLYAMRTLTRKCKDHSGSEYIVGVSASITLSAF